MSSRQLYPAPSPGTVLLAFDASLISRSYLEVFKRDSAEGAEQIVFGGEQLVSGVDFTFVGPGQIQLTVAADGATDYLLQRATPRVPLVEQQPGVLSSAKVNLAVLQQSHVNEEQDDAVLDGLAILDSRYGRNVRTELDTMLPISGSRPGKFLSFDPSGNPITMEVGDADPTLRTQLAEAALNRGAYTIGYRHPGTGARLYSDGLKLQQVVSVLDFVPDNYVPGDDVGAAIAEAVTALGSSGGAIHFPGQQAYYIGTKVTLVSKSNLQFVGEGATLTAATNLTEYFALDGCTDIRFSGLRFDGMFGTRATYSNYASGQQQVPIYAYNGSARVRVEGCVFFNLYTVFIRYYNSSDLEVLGCHFSSPLQDQQLRLEFIEMLTCGGNSRIQGNSFIGATTTINTRSPCAVAVSGIIGKLLIADNYANHCGRNNAGAHRLAVFDFYADVSGATVRDNTALNCREQFMRISTGTDIQVRNNNVTIASQADATYSSLSIESGSFPAVPNPTVKRVVIADNIIRCLGNAQAFAIGVSAYDWGAGCEDITVERNAIQGHETAFVLAGPYKAVTFRGNQVKNVKAFLAQTLFPGGLSSLTTDLGTQANARMEDLRVTDNHIEVAAGSAFTPVSLSTNNGSPFTGAVGLTTFKNNFLTGAPSGTSIALTLLFNTSTPSGQFECEGNYISGYVTPFYLRNAVRARVRDNVVMAMTSPIITDGSMGLIEAYGNRGVNDRLYGRGTLVSGQLTVNTAEVKTGDRVRVWREVQGGTIGTALVCNPANHVNATSLRIDAIDTTGGIVTTDTSEVGWEIYAQ